MSDSKFDLKVFIQEIEQNQKKIIYALEYQLDKDHRDDLILDYFNYIKSQTLNESALYKKVADYCQLLNNAMNFTSVSLEQIRDIYTRLIQIQPYNIEYYESLAFYLNNVLDSPKEAKEVLNKGIENIEKKIADLKVSVKGFE